MRDEERDTDGVEPARTVAVLGATGSIGAAALSVIRRHPERFRVAALSANGDARGLDELAREFAPELTCLAGGRPEGWDPGWTGDWRWDGEGLVEACRLPTVDAVVNGLVGFAGLESTVAALRAGKRLALANKESLVAGGELVLEAAEEGGGELLPVDSEHSAIHQCLSGRPARDVRRLILTASGGPFRNLPAERFDGLGPEDALEHPTWEMGRKITVDSATLANKALEVIEAHFLFGVPYERIDAVVHPESVVHSMVEFRDGSVLAQLGKPDMEKPLLYALSYPERVDDDPEPFDPVASGTLTFERVRTEDFPMFNLGVEAGRSGGVAPAVYNAANEVAVSAFLDGRVDFPGIPRVVREALEEVPPVRLEGLESVREADRRARREARAAIEGPAEAAG